MILAAPLVIPFAEAVGISIATLGMAKAADMVNDYIQENPEKSAMILKTLVPNLGIGEIFMKKGKDEEVEEEVSVEDIDSKDLTREEKAKMMKELAKSGASREKMIKGYEEIIQPGEDRTLVDAEERYDEGGVEDAPKPKFDYKKFFRKRRADGGAIGIEVLFEEKKPRKNFQEGGYEPLFTEDVETFTAPIGLNTTNVPSRIGKTYTDATNEAFRIGNVANRTGLTNPESIMKVSEMPMAVRTLSDINRMDPSSNLIADKYEKQGLSSDYRHTLGTSAFKDSIIDYVGSNLGIDKQSGILDTVGSLAAKGATVFEEGKDAISSLKQYYKDKERVGEKSPELFNLKLSEILAQPIEDYEANFFAADQIPFGTSPLKKMEMIQAYRKFGMDNYMQQLENQKKAAMQEKIRKAEAAAKAEAARAAQYGATNYGQGAGGQSYSGDAVGAGNLGFGVGATTGGPVSNRTGRGRTGYDDGGRVGLFMGGPALEGQALNIYNSMNSYGFSDQEIANTLQGQGLYTPGGSTPDAPDTGIISAQLNNDKGSTPIGAPSSLVSDFKTQTQNRQNRLTNPNKVQSFINKFTGGGQADIGEMIRTGQIDTRASSGIPLGVGAAFAKMMPDKYYDMSLGDQVFTQSQMGYTGPTVFGENTSGLNKDPFGLNTRSAFGNYAEAVGEDFANLSESLSGRLADKYGVEFDEETGMFVGANAKLANQMTNMMRTKFNFRKDQLAAKNRLDAQIKAAEAERQKQIELQKKIEAEAAAGKSLSQIGRENFTGEGQAFERRSDTFSGGKVKDTGGVPGGKYGSPRKDGGLMFAKGGLATMFVEKR